MMREIERLRAAIAAKEVKIAEHLAPVENLVRSQLKVFVEQVPEVFYLLPLSDFKYYEHHPYRESNDCSDWYEECSFRLNGNKFEIRRAGRLRINVNGRPLQGQEIFGSYVDDLLFICDKLPLVINKCNQALEVKRELREKQKLREQREQLRQQASNLGIDLENLSKSGEKSLRPKNPGSTTQFVFFLILAGIVVGLLSYYLPKI